MHTVYQEEPRASISVLVWRSLGGSTKPGTMYSFGSDPHKQYDRGPFFFFFFFFFSPSPNWGGGAPPFSFEVSRSNSISAPPAHPHEVRGEH
jgi:hypothetical protein